MKKLLFVIVTFILLLYGCSQEKGSDAGDNKNSASDGQVTGTYIMDGKASKINYVYVWYEPDMFDKTKQELHLLFSDNGIPKSKRNFFDIAELSRKGKVSAMEIRYSREANKITGGNPYHKRYGDKSYSFSGSFIFKVDLRFTGDNHLEGKISTKKPRVDIFKHEWEFNVSFEASLKDIK